MALERNKEKCDTHNSTILKLYQTSNHLKCKNHSINHLIPWRKKESYVNKLNGVKSCKMS